MAVADGRGLGSIWGVFVNVGIDVCVGYTVYVGNVTCVEVGWFDASDWGRSFAESVCSTACARLVSYSAVCTTIVAAICSGDGQPAPGQPHPG